MEKQATEQNYAKLQMAMEQTQAKLDKANEHIDKLMKENSSIKDEQRKLENQLDVHHRRKALLDRGEKTWAGVMVDLRREVEQLKQQMGDMPQTLAAREKQIEALKQVRDRV